MTAARQVWQICLYNFSAWRRNPRIVVTFGLAFVLCFLLTDKAVRFGRELDSIMQAFEPFIWIFGDPNSILLASLLLVLLFADMPFLGPGVPFYLVRTTRARWMAGQVLYITLATLLYMGFILVCSVAICAKDAFIGDKWSQTAAMLGYSPAGRELALPSMVRAMEMATPYECMGAIFGLMLLYTLLCAFIMFVFNLKLGRFWGILSVFIFSLYGFFMNPEVFKIILKIEDEQMMYRANVAAGWASPLNHATYYMHTFGYDLLPKLGQSCLIFFGLFVILALLSYLVSRRYNFKFTGTQSAGGL